MIVEPKSLAEWKREYLAKQRAPAPWTFDGHTFARYTASTQKHGTHKNFSLETLLRVPDIMARAENSGSEACYVEVVRWSWLRDRWERFAFAKCFGGEIKEFPDIGDAATCEMVADLINERHHTKRATMFHSFPSFNNPV